MWMLANAVYMLDMSVVSRHQTLETVSKHVPVTATVSVLQGLLESGDIRADVDIVEA